ncbi:MAG: protein-export chaperone SecB [Hyphomicrobiaceae bacterium]|nr:protein-export chaperone SecB [Hyphomicrobiaceae bacterium]MCC0023893.1 protein-export chaperone SecB [Hyphomicrobiaceae bacterium]
MADNDTPAEGAAAANPAAGQPAPQISIAAQYIRDLSFENPEAPKSIMAGPTPPHFNVGINVGVKKQEDDLYAVELTINAKAERDSDVLFSIELIYGGLFRLMHVPEQQLPLFLMIECPRLIFPFARQTIASVVQAGGFPPMLMEPVDFAQIYRQNLQRMAEMQQQAVNGGAEKSN